MAFTTRRGRPRAPALLSDPGTPELRLKHALGLTAEPIDLCLSRGLVTNEQHWCALHLRWLYTLRYGAPSLTTRYTDHAGQNAGPEETLHWRAIREEEYHCAITLLKHKRRYEPVMRLCVFNELPSFLNHSLRERAASDTALADQLLRSHHSVIDGLDILVNHWRRRAPAKKTLPNTL